MKTLLQSRVVSTKFGLGCARFLTLDEGLFGFQGV